MDRLNQIRGEAGSSRDLTLDTSSPPSEAFMTANESSSKYFSLSEVDSTFGISPSKDSLSVSTAEADHTITAENDLISNLSPIPKKSDLDSYKIGKQIEAANILSGGVNIFDDNDNSYDGDELVIDDNVGSLEEEKSCTDLKSDETRVPPSQKSDEILAENLDVTEEIPSKDTEVVLQIDGKNVDAIDIGNGLYLYRKEGQEELAAVQIVDDDQQQPSFKFLKVRENAEGNLEVYEEIQIEVPKEVPSKEGIPVEKTSHVPIKDINKVINEPSSNKLMDKIKTPKIESNHTSDLSSESNVDSESKTEVNLNGKMMKFNESRKSPLIGTFTPMTYHSTPNKEGIPLTKTMVDQQLHPSRHSDNIKKTIEVHTDNCKQKSVETPTKLQEVTEVVQSVEDVTNNQENDSCKNELSVMDVDENCKNKNEEIKELILESTEINTTKESNDTNKKESQEISANVIDKEKENIESSQKEIKNIDKEISDVDKSKYKEISSVLSISEDIEDKINPDFSTESNNLNIIESQDSIVNDKEIKDRESPDLLIVESNNMDDKSEESDDLKLKDLNDDPNKIKAESQKSIVTTEGTDNKLEECDVIKLKNRNDYPIKINSESIEIPETNKESKIVDHLDKKNITENAPNTDRKCLQELPNIPKLKLDEDSVPKKSNIEMTSSEKSKTLIAPDSLGKNKQNESIVEPLPKSKLIQEKKHEDTTKINKIINNTVMTTINEKDSVDGTIAQSVLHNDVDKNIEIADALGPKSAALLSINQNDHNDIHKGSCDTQNDKKDEIRDNSVLEEQNLKEKNINADGTTNKSKSEINILPVENKLISQANISANPNIRKNAAITNVESKPNPIIDVTPNHDITFSSIGVRTKDPQPILPSEKLNQNKKELKPEIPKTKPIEDTKKVNNNNTAVPFGKWTEANRQEFLNKIKETKIPSNNSNTKQIKQPNDLNRRDVLKKIDSQRQSTIAAAAKVADFGIIPKLNSRTEPAFVNKNNISQLTNKSEAKAAPLKPPTGIIKQKQEISKKVTKDQPALSGLSTTQKLCQGKDINNQDLIDKTIEGIINRPLTAKSTSDSPKDCVTDSVEKQTNQKQCPVTLDDIEMKMNELHGIPFVERPAHEVPHIYNRDNKSNSKTDKLVKTKVPHLVPFKNKGQQKIIKENVPEDTSDDEIIEHEPITGDIDVNKQNLMSLLASKEKIMSEPKKDTIITERDFDKFARRNSITYENCLTVNFDSKETHNVIQTVVEKEAPVKKLSRNELMLAESKAKSSNKQLVAARNNNHASKIPTSVKTTTDDDTINKKSKVQMAYQTALTAKRHLECPISIIEDKPVKVVYMDTEYTPTHLKIQTQELSPSKKQSPDSEVLGHSASESLDSDILESCYENKTQDDAKSKSKHQRKQVLTPVEEPELELIEPDELGIEITPKKKRKLDDKSDKNVKNVVPKKSYLLNRNTTDEQPKNEDPLTKPALKEPEMRNETFVSRTDTISAIDNLVKAAELIETQSENNSLISVPNPEIPQNTPVKRGRGRPRKYPPPESGSEVYKAPSPQKKPKLLDAKPSKTYSDSDESSDGEIKENWTMGKINENIVCPICNKLFRSENVVFKHVKHCTGPSPNRSDSDKRSPRRMRYSQESDGISNGSRSDYSDKNEVEKPRSRKSNFNASKSENINSDIIVIEDTPIKQRLDKSEDVSKVLDTKKTLLKSNLPHRSSNLICEICGKTFRQLSYLVNHKQLHKKEEIKTSDKEERQQTSKQQPANKSVFSCEVCKKEFRKLHHLVQHRIIHNPNTRVLRKSSSEQHDYKSHKTNNDVKQSEDQSAGFRCEPCDKSFRKLHHLVEHRETHDGINKRGTSTTQTTNTNEPVKSSLVHQCDLCKKSFKKIQHLLEHKEQHYETSSEKSDDKSVKSSLSTKDIIHECSLCYMVFPNEHSLNKHAIICLKKKRQSASKQAKQSQEKEEIDADNNESNETKQDTQLNDTEPSEEVDKNIEKPLEHLVPPPEIKEKEETADKETKLERDIEENLVKRKRSQDAVKAVQEKPEKENDIVKSEEKTVNEDEKPTKNKRIEVIECITIPDTPTPKKKVLKKEKATATVTKRQKSINAPPAVIEYAKPSVESSDDDDIRYMLNPNLNIDDTSEGKLFMKVRAKKRSSLQIERPNSKDLVKRRISLQHPPKIPRLKAKPIEAKPTNKVAIEKSVKAEPVPSTDSDDSDIKYSFPETNALEAVSKDVEKKAKRQSIAAKRKSLCGIAKRKSLGKHKLATPTNKTKRRTTQAEHRCDCGQLFSSAALLARHTTLAHTPPRIRRRRSPPPETQIPKKQTNKPKTTPPPPKKPRSDVTDSNTTTKLGVGTRKSSVNNSEPKTSSDAGKIKSEFGGKSLRSAAHKGVPVPEKMRKMMEKYKK